MRITEIVAELSKLRGLVQQALSRAGASGGISTAIATNLVQLATGTGTVSGQHVSFIAPNITAADGSVGNFQVAATLAVVATASDALTFQLYRGTTAIGPAVPATADAAGKAVRSITWTDTAQPTGAQAYSIRCTDSTSSNTVAVNGSGSSSINVQQTL